MKKIYGLIGYPLSHSFSKKYFTQKFENEGISDSEYQLFELKQIEEIQTLLQNTDNLKGLNVTIPYKEQVIKYLSALAPTAQAVGAVNVIRVEKDGRLVGHNSDCIGFEESLKNFLADKRPQALVLGTGGAAKAVFYVLERLGISYQVVSRKADADKNILSYEQVTSDILKNNLLIINTTPLGMSPNTASFPPIDYSALSEAHYCFDLVYNPTETTFMQKAAAQGAKTANGLEMLHLQAEGAWKIWNE